MRWSKRRKAFREGASPKELASVASAETIERVTRDADYRRWTSEFLGGD